MKCLNCNSGRIIKSGHRQTKSGRVQKYYCKACNRSFRFRFGILTKMNNVKKDKKYYIRFREIVDEMVNNHQRISSRDVHKKMASRHMRGISFNTINNWLNKFYPNSRQ